MDKLLILWYNCYATTNGVLTYYVYDGNVVIEEQSSNNSESARNVYGRNLITREVSSDKNVYGYNGHGDVVYLTDTDGIVQITYDYDEFGNPVETTSYRIQPKAPGMVEVEDAEEKVEIITSAIYNPYRYACYEYIEEIGIYDLNARYYNPEIVRFLSQDPYYDLGNRVIGFYEINDPTAASIMQANNLYAYCGNNPATFIDPQGESFVAGIIGIVVIALVGVGVSSCENTSSYKGNSTSTSINSLPQNVQNSYNSYSANGWSGNYAGQTPGTHAGGAWSNFGGLLPSTDSFGSPITYQEFDVNNKIDGKNRDGERFIVGSDGSVYYTWDHYVSFKKIK